MISNKTVEVFHFDRLGKKKKQTQLELPVLKNVLIFDVNSIVSLFNVYT